MLNTNWELLYNKLEKIDLWLFSLEYHDVFYVVFNLQN